MADKDFDFSQLIRLGNDLKASLQQFRGDAFSILVKESTLLRWNIKTRMPVDTGAAKLSWGSKSAGAVAAAKGLSGIWEEDPDNLSITQGAERDQYNYIIRLNEGYSSQAPAGFIDDEFEKAQDAVDEAIQQLLENLV